MSTIRRSSRSGGNAAPLSSSSSSPTALESQQSAPSPSESSYQSTEPHEKRDQVLEASDPDLNPASSSVTVSPTASPAVVEQLEDAVGTPINDDFEEEEPAESNVDTGDEEVEQDDDQDQEVSVETPEDNDDEVQSIRLDAGALNHATASTANGGGVEGRRPAGEVIHTSGNPIATTKHTKRPADDYTIDSNTVQDDETQDYLTGAYKSPFRHTHKAEKAGKEER